jgi:aminoglycoside 6'-N-acetyltransferase I
MRCEYGRCEYGECDPFSDSIARGSVGGWHSRQESPKTVDPKNADDAIWSSTDKSDVTLRRATKNDIPVWARMRNRLWPETSTRDHVRELRQSIKDKKFKAWIAYGRDVPIGFAELYIRPFANGCLGKPVPFLEGIWVNAEHRRSGVGKALVDAVFRWAQKRGYEEIGSDANIQNTVSHQCHLGWGFMETERVVYFRKELRA